MTDKTAAPLYDLRGLKLIGWRDMQHALDYLYADGEIKRGTLVAMNAEKLLTVEDDPVVRALIEAQSLNMLMVLAWFALCARNFRRRRSHALPVPISGNI